jgi:hypothetical protein
MDSNVPVLERVCTKIDIVVSGGRAIDLDGTNNTVTILATEVRVIPSGSVLCSLELIRLAISWSNGAYFKSMSIKLTCSQQR